MTKKSASMSRDEFAEVINTTGPFRFTVHGESTRVEKPFATLDEPRPYPLERAPMSKYEPGERMRRLDELVMRYGVDYPVGLRCAFDIEKAADQMRRLPEAS